MEDNILIGRSRVDNGERRSASGIGFARHLFVDISVWRMLLFNKSPGNYIEGVQKEVEIE